MAAADTTAIMLIATRTNAIPALIRENRAKPRLLCVVTLSVKTLSLSLVNDRLHFASDLCSFRFL